MSMRFSHMISYWEADEALEIINLLDQLRDVLWINYREEIEAMQQANRHHRMSELQQQSLDLEDPMPF